MVIQSLYQITSNRTHDAQMAAGYLTPKFFHQKKHAMANQPYHKPNLSYSGHTAKEPSTYSATFLQFNIHLFSTKSEKQKKKTNAI
jgi:hypothetical protein